MELFNLFLGFSFSVVLVFILYVLSMLVSITNISKQKLSTYECGFNPFSDSRDQFNVHFYLVAILFIVFDLELSFLFPWGISLDYIGVVSYIVIYLFLLILTIGFLYEWIKGVLDWY